MSVNTVYRLARSGDLPAVHLAGPGSSIRVRAAAIDDLLGQYTNKPEAA